MIDSTLVALYELAPKMSAHFEERNLERIVEYRPRRGVEMNGAFESAGEQCDA